MAHMQAQAKLQKKRSLRQPTWFFAVAIVLCCWLFAARTFAGNAGARRPGHKFSHVVLRATSLEVGDEITGKVVAINEPYVTVEFGGRTARLYRTQLDDDETKLPAEIGQVLPIGSEVVGWVSKLLSKKTGTPVTEMTMRKSFSQRRRLADLEVGSTVEGKVEDSNPRIGLFADIGAVRAALVPLKYFAGVTDQERINSMKAEFPVGTKIKLKLTDVNRGAGQIEADIAR